MNPDEPKETFHQSGPEPVAERWTITMWLIILFALLIYGGSLFMA